MASDENITKALPSPIENQPRQREQGRIIAAKKGLEDDYTKKKSDTASEGRPSTGAEKRRRRRQG